MNKEGQVIMVNIATSLAGVKSSTLGCEWCARHCAYCELQDGKAVEKVIEGLIEVATEIKKENES